MYLTVVLLVSVILAGIYIIWEDKRNWELLYESTGYTMHDAQARFAYLKTRGIKCRLKTSSARGMSFTGMTSPAAMSSVKLEVHKKDSDKARALLVNYKL